MKNDINENKALSQTSVTSSFFDFDHWNKCNALWKVSPHHYSNNLVIIEYTGTSKMRISVCVEKNEFESGLNKFWAEFKRQSENNAMRN
jgi:hypothetical protein